MASIFTTTIHDTITKTVAATASPSSSDRATPQGGILEHGDPTKYDPKNPLILFIIQAGIIIVFCRLLHWPLAKIRQPRVIAEVIGGILLGPSVMGRIPGFTSTIFPQAAMPNLSLVANLGLILFLFLVGLEVDLRFLVSNWKVAASVGLAGMILPFGLGCAIAWGLYNEFRNEPGTVPINFGTYMLFIGVAMAITAFPVLCRILTELKLLLTPVGVIVLSAGVGNDVVGWILLALCVALVNANDGISALYVLLTSVGYILFMVYAVRPIFIRVLHRNRAIQDGPSQSMIALTLLIVLTSSFFTGVIGIHAIFGAFVAGLICPHEGGFAIKVTEKIEDLVSTILLPLYFAYSGLGTNIGLLDSGIVWGYVLAVTAVAFSAKFIGASLAARTSGMVWRECFTIGSLMSCKGLVELIVLNIGLQAKILSTRTFTIFVVMALVTTFATTPLTAALYPPWYQIKIEQWKRGEIDWDTGKPLSEDPSSTRDSVAYEKIESARVQKLLVYLRLDNMPTLLAFMSLLGGTPQSTPKLHPQQQATREDNESINEVSMTKRPIEAHGVRLLELTDRDSSVMQVSELDEYSHHDPLVNTFRTFGRLHNLAVSGEVTVLPESSFSDALVSRASYLESDLLLLPWTETGSMSETQNISIDAMQHKLANSAYITFISEALKRAPCNAAVFLNKNFGGTSTTRTGDRPGLARSRSVLSMSSEKQHAPQAPVADQSHHIFCPFFGGPDDRLALRLVLQMAENPDVTATIVHFETHESFFGSTDEITESPPIPGGLARKLTVVVEQPPPAERDTIFFASLKNSIPAELAARVLFVTINADSGPVKAAHQRAGEEVGQAPRNAGDLIVLGRNSGRVAAFAKESGRMTAESEKCLGFLGQELVQSNLRASVIVVQAQESAGRS
ncbi:hypothetical protein EJ08DRAFT_721007 [Tothia fuscella]|uniref:Cation/H+ exchanger transmembrane domain-containing protein n=1 Tax=Tothia fuscella TaxID=1048955 RepID=A0A9P4TVG6_9PEZI|nr:hypothetical protein EJ08DRAFT_721007 [Tothia fuscella]